MDFNGEGLEERRLLLDRISINLGSPDEPECFPDWKEYHKERMADLIRQKAPAASRVHGQSIVGGEPLNDLFVRPYALMEKLQSSGLVDVENPQSSRLFDLMKFEGPMYRVFRDDERTVILDWLHSLGHSPAPCLDKLPDSPPVGTWPERMVKVIEDYAGLGRRAHQGLALPDGSGTPTPIIDLFDDPAALMQALVRGGWVVPGSPSRSLFVTQILEGGPMSGVFDEQSLEAVRGWIEDGARLIDDPGAANIKPATAMETAASFEPGLEFTDLRPFIGQGAVH